jgi:TusA-related sulfurtransferase
MAIEIDARGLSCPEPALRTKGVLEKAAAGEEVLVIVDTMTQVYNCTRIAEGLGWKAAWEDKGESIELRLTR